MESIQQFRNQHLLNPEFLVVAGAGIEHEQLVSWTHQYFGHLQQPKDTGSSIIPSQYMGGYSRLGLAPSSPMLSTTTHEYPHPHHHASPPLTPPPSPSSTLIPDPFTRVSLSFPTGGWHQTTDLVPACVLQTLLGGGNSFSAGGPGKGMYSRLYREILNRYYWAESAEAFTLFYQEVGLMGMNGSCSTPDKGRDLTHVLADHFIQLLTTPVSDEELYRARNMLKCNVLTQLESRLVLFEDVARQIGTYGKRETAQEMCEKIDAVTKEDIQRVIQTSVRGNRPTLCAMGENLDRVIPALEEVETWFRSI
jgi:processing peptidase subunit alpha